MFFSALPLRLARLLALPLLAAFFLLAAPLYAGNFLSLSEDLPLAPRLVEQADGVLFEAAGGSIMESYAEGPTTPKAILSFYDSTLPQLGWTKIATGRYEREQQSLSIAAETTKKGARAHFSLTMHP